MKVNLLTIGDEILIGQIVDTNSAWMARELNLIGASITGIRSVGDEQNRIIGGLQEALRQADVVLMTGGLGPTKDDITKKAIAAFFGVEMVFDEATYERIVRIFEGFGRPVKPAHREQCFMPANARLLFNKMGTAPGMWFDHGDQVIVSMPGVPYEMEYLMAHQVIPLLKQRFPGRPIAHRTLLTAGDGESNIAARIEGFETALPPNIKLAYLPNLGQVRLRLTGTGDDEQTLQQQLDTYAAALEKQLDDIVFGRENLRLEEVVGHSLRERGLTLGTAESCTGGYLAHLITAIPGASDYFKGGVVAYANALKMKTLGVNHETLDRFGAVSEQTVTEMVQGALETLNVDLAVAVSGIAGPGGGSPEKPVGTIWIAVGDKESVQTFKLQAGKDRLKNIEYAAVHALNLLRLFVREKYPLAQTRIGSPD